MPQVPMHTVATSMHWQGGLLVVPVTVSETSVSKMASMGSIPGQALDAMNQAKAERRKGSR